MGKLHSVQIEVDGFVKEISVHCDDVTDFGEHIDILTTSAYVGSYVPTPRTVFEALYIKGIDAEVLAENPEFDLRTPCHVWLSEKIQFASADIGRIGCIELIGLYILDMSEVEIEQSILNSIRAYFRMLDIAAVYGIKMETVALPMLGSGSQRISQKLLLIPLLNECISFLERNHDVKRILFIERNPQKAEEIAQALRNSLRFVDGKKAEIKKKEMAFISYSSKDTYVAERLCAKLDEKGIKYWYAPRDVEKPYAGEIVRALDESSHFILILSKNSMDSEHVLNEVDLAFNRSKRNNLKFKPLRIDDCLFNAEFEYYMARKQWHPAMNPPLEERLDEFISFLLK